MRTASTCRFLFTFAIALGAVASAIGQTEKKPESATPARDLFIDLDANNDRVVERAEVPEGGQKAFEILLKYGDENHDGKLEAPEFRALLEKVGRSNAIPPEQRERRFKNLDKNQDGKLDRQEFLGGAPRFTQLDRNADGFLSRDEIPWLNPAGPRPGAASKGTDLVPAADGPFLKRLKAMDKDGDGRISRDEFSGRPAMFDRLDANHDGFIDKVDRREPATPELERKPAQKPAR